MSPSTSTPSGGFSLFPNTGRPPSRTQGGAGPRAPTPQRLRSVSPDQGAGQFPAPAIGEAMTAEVRIESPAPVADVQRRGNNVVQEPARSSSVRSRSSIAKVRLSMYDENPPFDDDPVPPMPGQASSTIDGYQQQQHHQQHQQQQQQQNRPPALRSIFPQYNPEVSLDQQEYYPTQTSPTRIPRAVISRPLYSPVSPAEQQQQQRHQSMDMATGYAPNPAIAVTSPSQASNVYSPSRPRAASPSAAPLSVNTSVSAPRPWSPPVVGGARSGPARQHHEAPKLPVPSKTEDLRNFWKIANGWKAGPSEGRVYTLKMSCDPDAPVYRLASASGQPFYRLQLDPRAMSAYVTLARHDPARPFKGDTKNAGGSGADGAGGAGDGAGGSGDGGDGGSGSSVLDMGLGGGSASVLGSSADASSVHNAAAAAQARLNARADASKNWQVALTTTLEEESRRHRPHGDGLVALLYPAAAARMALERPHDAAMVATAERECARLVWDDDAASYFLAHPALALPFRVTIERSTTWSRTAYTLEHLESPQHLARLTRDGTGAGYLEIDVGVAAQIDAVYLVDVVTAALVLVAHSDGEFRAVETFAPPPDLAAAGGGNPMGANESARGSLVNMVMGHGRSNSRLSFASKHSAKDGGKKSKKNSKKSGRSRMDTFDVDLESQTSIDLSGKMFEMGPMNNVGGQTATSSKNKKKKKTKDDDKEKMPTCLRLIGFLFKCCFWCVALCVRALFAIAGGIFKCLTNEKL